jgi:hypothetical protein
VQNHGGARDWLSFATSSFRDSARSRCMASSWKLRTAVGTLTFAQNSEYCATPKPAGPRILGGCAKRVAHKARSFVTKCTKYAQKSRVESGKSVWLTVCKLSKSECCGVAVDEYTIHLYTYQESH